MTNKIGGMLACLACMGQGLRLQNIAETLQDSNIADSHSGLEIAKDLLKSSKAFAKLLLEFNSASAFGTRLAVGKASGSEVGHSLAQHQKIARRTSLIRMDPVDSFGVSRVIKEVRVFEGDYAADIAEAVKEVGEEAIRIKNSFSLAIPGGSVVAALGGLDKEALDFSKVHIFFVNEKVPSYPCLEGALEQTRKLGVPDENVHGIGKEGELAEIAEEYTKLLREHPSIDNSGVIPAVDMMLLGTGPDGHCGCIFPDSAEVRATGSGKVMLAGNDERADGDFVAASIDMMCASKVVLVSAAGAGRAPMVAKALSGDFGKFDCPAALVEGEEGTFWFSDKEGIAEYEDVAEDEEGYDD